MSLIALLEQTKQVAIATREEIAQKNAQEIADYEEFGADMAAALDEQELASAEEALRLGLEFDEREDEESSEREKADLEFARKCLEEDVRANSEAAVACDKDGMLAKQLDDQLRAEAVRVAKLERRERQLAQRKLCKGDVQLAEQLAQDIDEEEWVLRETERRDRRLASRLVKEESKALASLPQTEEKLRDLSRAINGDGPIPLRTRLRAKLDTLRKGLNEITNSMNGSNTARPEVAA